MDLILIKNRVSHLLRKGGSRGLMGNESGLDCNTESTGDEWRDYVQPSSLGGFKIHLSEGSSLGSSTSEGLFRI